MVPIWQRNNAIRSSFNSHQYTFTNSTVPITEPLVSNLTFDALSCDGSFLSFFLSISKEVSSFALMCKIIMLADAFQIQNIVQ
ncbi:hypothetical protein H8356DRAFT_1344658 [Neocallimastix lanati (nom. inval.)]|nr:hypothetical protein H8356DRAFT_1344658 [Neocallimastix sp. JGI-2020a]